LKYPVPDKEARMEILQVHTRKLDLEGDVDLELVADQLEDEFTGRDIQQVVRQAAVNALEESEDIKNAKVSMDDFNEAVKDLKEGNLGVEKDFLNKSSHHPDEMFA